MSLKLEVLDKCLDEAQRNFKDATSDGILNDLIATANLDNIMSTPQPARTVKVGVQISKETGGAYADVQEVIESELARIREEWSKKANADGTIRDIDNRDQNNGRRPVK